MTVRRFGQRIRVRPEAIDEYERLRIINEVVKPRYAHLRASETQVVSAAPA